MKIVCAWCGALVYEGQVFVDGEEWNPEGSTHAICEECARAQLLNWKKEKAKVEYLKSGITLLILLVGISIFMLIGKGCGL